MRGVPVRDVRAPGGRSVEPSDAVPTHGSTAASEPHIDVRQDKSAVMLGRGRTAREEEVVWQNSMDTISYAARVHLRF